MVISFEITKKNVLYGVFRFLCFAFFAVIVIGASWLPYIFLSFDHEPDVIPFAISITVMHCFFCLLLQFIITGRKLLNIRAFEISSMISVLFCLYGMGRGAILFNERLATSPDYRYSVTHFFYLTRVPLLFSMGVIVVVLLAKKIPVRSESSFFMISLFMLSETIWSNVRCTFFCDLLLILIAIILYILQNSKKIIQPQTAKL